MTHSYKEHVFMRRDDAESVLSNLKGLVYTYGYATVHDFYEMVGIISSDPDDRDFGWIDLDETRIKHNYNSISMNDTYKIDFAEARILEIRRPVTKQYSGAIDDGGERISYGEDKADREPSTGKGRFELMSPYTNTRLAKWYELGAEKYGPRNWEKGIPFSRCIDSAKRHIEKFIMGMTDEDHLAAAIWNLSAIVHYEEMGMIELDDMPHFEDHKINKEDNDEN